MNAPVRYLSVCSGIEVAALATEVRRAPELPDLPDSDAEDFDVECGQACRSEAA